MDPVIFNSLSEEQRFWYGEAMIRIITADGKRHESEEFFLYKVIHMFQDRRHKEHMNDVLNGKMPPVRKLTGMSESTKMMIFYDCVVVAVSDGEFVKEEEIELYHLANELNMRKEEAERVIQWGKSLIHRLSPSY